MEEFDRFYYEIEGNLVDLALISGYSQDQLISRQLVPSDLGLQKAFLVDASPGRSNVISAVVPRGTFVAIYGVSYGGNNIYQIDLLKSGGLVKMWNLQSLYASDNPNYVDRNAAYFEEGETISVDVYADSMSGENLVILGIVVEKEGNTVVY